MTGELIQATVVGANELAQKLDQGAAGFVLALQDGIGRAVLRVQARVKDKLSDQVLHVRTGRLRRSITQVVETHGEKVEGVVGTNVEYAPIHEYGFSGTETVAASFRTSKLGKGFGVTAHTRQVHMPERSFIRSALNELQPDIRTMIERAVSDHIMKVSQG